MTELINKLIGEAGLSSEQASKTLDVIKSFVKDKFPMLSGAVDNVFGAPADDAATAVVASETVAVESKSWLDKISDILPGEMGEKIEGFAKKAADVASDGYDKAKDVAGDLYEKGKDKVHEIAKKID